MDLHPARPRPRRHRAIAAAGVVPLVITTTLGAMLAPAIAKVLAKDTGRAVRAVAAAGVAPLATTTMIGVMPAPAIAKVLAKDIGRTGMPFLRTRHQFKLLLFEFSNSIQVV